MFSTKNFEWSIFLASILILFLGSVTIYSVNLQFFQPHLLYLVFGILVYFFLSFFDYRVLEKFGNFFYFLAVFSLLTPFFAGVLSRGAVRWAEIGGITFQPSEFSKPLLIIFFSKFWEKREFNFKNLFLYLFYFSIPFFLIFFQPDLGSSLVVLAIAFGLIFFTTIKTKNFFLIIFSFLLTLPLAFNFLHDYQKERIIHFLNPWLDPLGSGYNVIQSITSVGSGKLTGKGFGKGTQSKLAFLPERHTDFIFASFSEEFGFFGSAFLVFLYFIIFKKILFVVKNTEDIFGSLICLGVFFMIFFQFFVNIGMNIGLLPITGITLPLFSYGGSSLISTLACLGLVQSVSRLNKKYELGFEFK